MTPVKRPANRRGTTRYDVNSPLRYRVPQANLPGGWKAGSIVDMSASGVLVQIAETLETGSILELELDWTGLYHAKPVRLLVTGPVVRTDALGTAIHIAHHEFQELGPSAVRPRRAERTLAVAS